jgi:acetyl-CoA synthetase
VAVAAVVPVKLEVKGKEPDMYVALQTGMMSSSESLPGGIQNAVVAEIGGDFPAEKT